MPAIYQADTWCDDCADAIKATIQEPEDPNDESSYDSDEYPKYMGDDESSDSPCHCASGEDCLNAITLPSGRKVGMILGELTEDGEAYVREAIEDGGEVAELWKEHFGL
jgi:hypothetical protein